MPRNSEKINKNRVRKCIWVLLVMAVTLLAFNTGWWALAQEGHWTAPTVISAPPGFSWFPDLAVDAFGSVHVVWCQTIPLGERRGLQEQVSYARWNGESWSAPNDIVPPSADIVRNAIASDLVGNVHLLSGGSVYGVLALYHQKAPLSEAWSARAWSTPHRINQGTSYMGDIAIDSRGVIHVIYDDILGYADEDGLVVADIFYRRSTDGGQTWSVPISLYPKPLTGSARASLEIDSNDVIHVTWDEGWDRLRGGGEADHSVYTSSEDGGKTWSPAIVIDYPDSTVAQLTVGSDGQGGVMLVWRTASQEYPGIYYMWSTDQGGSWSPPQTLPDIVARPWGTPFDLYDMATDSAGHIHLFVVGRESQEEDALVGVYHLVWDGVGWSTPMRIFASMGLYPEYPKIVVHEGNQLHAAWFTREGSVFDQEVNREVWYSSSQSAAPHQPVTPLPPPTLTPPTATPTAIPTAMPYPTLSLEDTGLPDGLYTESDDVFQLAIALSPVALVILVMAIKIGWLGKLRR